RPRLWDLLLRAHQKSSHEPRERPRMPQMQPRSKRSRIDRTPIADVRFCSTSPDQVGNPPTWVQLADDQLKQDYTLIVRVSSGAASSKRSPVSPRSVEPSAW